MTDVAILDRNDKITILENSKIVEVDRVKVFIERLNDKEKIKEKNEIRHSSFEWVWEVDDWKKDVVEGKGYSPDEVR